jgi:hypothetical protein
MGRRGTAKIMSSKLRSKTPSAKAAVASPEQRHREEVLRRYQDLVEQKYLRGLTGAEQAEMEHLGNEIDGFYDAFYEPILARVRERLQGKASGG